LSLRALWGATPRHLASSPLTTFASFLADGVCVCCGQGYLTPRPLAGSLLTLIAACLAGTASPMLPMLWLKAQGIEFRSVA
jgi:hypothetical protein